MIVEQTGVEVKCRADLDLIAKSYRRPGAAGANLRVTVCGSGQNPRRTDSKEDPMEMHQIRYFLAVCDELNFTRAAERCNVAQPSLTRAIKLLL